MKTRSSVIAVVRLIDTEIDRLKRARAVLLENVGEIIGDVPVEKRGFKTGIVADVYELIKQNPGIRPAEIRERTKLKHSQVHNTLFQGKKRGYWRSDLTSRYYITGELKWVR